MPARSRPQRLERTGRDRGGATRRATAAAPVASVACPSRPRRESVGTACRRGPQRRRARPRRVARRLHSRGRRACPAAESTARSARRPARRGAPRPGTRPRRACRRPSSDRAGPAQLVADERLDDREPGPRDDGADARAVVGDRQHDLAVPARELDADPVAAVLERVLQQLEKTSASAVARAPGSDTGSSSAVTSLPPPTPCTSIARRRSIRSASSTSSSRRSVSSSCTAAIARMRLTECSSASRGSIASADRACSRSSDATVCRLFFTRWWISWASTPRSTARPCSSATAACVAIDASSSRSASVNGPVAVGDELADLPAAPAQRLADRVRRRDALRPGDPAVVEHERGPGRVRARPSSS